MKQPESNRRKDPRHFDHAHASMGRFADQLALQYDNTNTQAAYYRCLRLIQDHFQRDPAQLEEDDLRDYFLFVKNDKPIPGTDRRGWSPKSVRQSLAAARVFYRNLDPPRHWKLFGEIKTKDREKLPYILTRSDVHEVIAAIRVRRFRMPVKVIYCCGLRISECLRISPGDIQASTHKLWIRDGKGKRDRVVPIPDALIEDLRHYWRFHRNPHWLFPTCGQGSPGQFHLRESMAKAKRSMRPQAVQTFLTRLQDELGMPHLTAHALRHSLATHLIEAGISIMTVQAVLGHKNLSTTLGYLHLTHEHQHLALEELEALYRKLPR